MSLVGLLRAYRKRKSIKLYLTKLGPFLARRFGKQEHYTPRQVGQAAQEAKLPMEDLCYGLSIFCTQDDFNAYHAASGENCHYWEMRVEVAEHHFHGNGAFTPQDIVAHSAMHSHGGTDAAGHDFGGGGGEHHGGH